MYITHRSGQKTRRVELAWRNCTSVMDGSIPGGNDVFTELHTLLKRYPGIFWKFEPFSILQCIMFCMDLNKALDQIYTIQDLDQALPF